MEYIFISNFALKMEAPIIKTYFINTRAHEWDLGGVARCCNASEEHHSSRRASLAGRICADKHRLFRRRAEGISPCKAMPSRRREALPHEIPAPPCCPNSLLHPGAASSQTPFPRMPIDEMSSGLSAMQFDCPAVRDKPCTRGIIK
jgi:hypothetical protein